jgi:hypothetical protein
MFLEITINSYKCLYKVFLQITFDFLGMAQPPVDHVRPEMFDKSVDQKHRS